MFRHTPWLLAALLATACGCNTERRSEAGFRLPPGGDAARGKAVFVSFGCPECHTISGLDLPRPAAASPIPVVLGGTVNHKPGDGYLVTSIIYPSYQTARYAARDIPKAGESRMPHYEERLTVQQLTDVVVFLQSRYIEPPAPPLTPY
jgi:hypothetical protein